MGLLTRFIALYVLLMCSTATAQVGPVPEYQLKATFLFQFTDFVDWPENAFPRPDSPLVICVLGQDPFGAVLDDTVRDEKTKTHPLNVVRYERTEDIRTCHVLFISRSEATRTREIADALKGRSILTVSDATGFADKGGMFQFVNRQNRVNLRVNLGAARSANLTVSSKLLRLADVINAEPR